MERTFITLQWHFSGAGLAETPSSLITIIIITIATILIITIIITTIITIIIIINPWQFGLKAVGFVRRPMAQLFLAFFCAVPVCNYTLYCCDPGARRRRHAGACMRLGEALSEAPPTDRP